MTAAIFALIWMGAGAAGWLDVPLTNWNDAAKIPVAAVTDTETVAQVARRCGLPLLRETPAERILADTGWLAYLHVDRQIVQRDVEILAGMTAADAMCRPVNFNVFVFVGGVFAGTLSPVHMTSRTDGAIGAVRLSIDDAISAEFARFQDTDALCCPSSRVSIRYRIDRAARTPVVIPVGIQSLR